MKKLLQKRLNNEKGLTLVELLAVIVILGIIAAIAVPSIGGIINNSKVGALKSDMLNAINAAELYAIDNPSTGSKTTITLVDLQGGAGGTVSEKYLEDAGGLTEFVYTYANKTITASATSGKVTLATNAATTKKQIIALPNNTNGTAGTLAVTR